MSILTSFFNLIKPAKTDGVKVSDFNTNMDIIDTEMHKPPLTVNGIAPNSTSRDLYLEQVPLADNLASDIAQISLGEFIQRTSGGGASIESGQASLNSVKGNIVRSGYTPESLTYDITGSDIDISVDRDTFVAYVSGVSGTYTLTYTNTWSADPALYGVTVTGTPVSGDEINIYFAAEIRGTITVATPSSFNSTGWNLYDNSTGRARVVAYSVQYGYRIGGTYSLVEFATTISGTRETVTVTDGNFNVNEDGYIFVTGGNETTYIYPTWTTWTDGYHGDFETYTVDTIDLSEAMVAFPNGLCAVGDVRDEINLNVNRTIQRIGRVAYSNLPAIIAMGVAYIYDENYVYYVLENPVTGSININGSYTVSDHGIEFFSGSTIPVYTETLYGENLKDKLRTDVLTISAQELSTSQKTQVQKNIGLEPTQATNVTTAGKVADARVIKTLFDSIAGKLTVVGREYTSYTSQGQANYDLNSSTRHLIIIMSANSDTNGMFIVQCGSGGTITAVEVYKGSNLTLNTATANKFRFILGTTYTTRLYDFDLTSVV